MTKEHTIKNGATKMSGCAEHIRKTFSAQGYKVEVVESNDADRKGLFVQVSNIKGAIGGLTKMATGLNVGVILKLWTDGEDLKFLIFGSKNDEPDDSRSVVDFDGSFAADGGAWTFQSAILCRVAKPEAVA